MFFLFFRSSTRSLYKSSKHIHHQSSLLDHLIRIFSKKNSTNKEKRFQSSKLTKGSNMVMPTHEKCTHSSNMSSPPDDKGDPKPTLEQLFSNYPIQTSLMQYLNVYDFRNVRLAGCRIAATSWAIQKKYLVQIHCDEFLPVNYWEREYPKCGHTPQQVEVMKPCQGLSLRPDDSPIPLGQPHFHDDSDQSKCFWVCDGCRSKKEFDYDRYTDFEGTFAQLCETHSLELQGFPENTCHCHRIAIGEWRCSSCIERSFELTMFRNYKAIDAMPSEVILFGKWTLIVRPQVDRWTNWLLRRLTNAKDAFNKSILCWFESKLGLRRRRLEMIKWTLLCPIENCGRPQWGKDVLIARCMWMCLGCKTVLPGTDYEVSRLWSNLL